MQSAKLNSPYWFDHCCAWQRVQEQVITKSQEKVGCRGQSCPCYNFLLKRNTKEVVWKIPHGASYLWLPMKHHFPEFRHLLTEDRALTSVDFGGPINYVFEWGWKGLPKDQTLKSVLEEETVDAGLTQGQCTSHFKNNKGVNTKLNWSYTMAQMGPWEWWVDAMTFTLRNICYFKKHDQYTRENDPSLKVSASIGPDIKHTATVRQEAPTEEYGSPSVD